MKAGTILFGIGLALFSGTEGYKMVFLGQTSMETGMGLLHHLGLILAGMGAIGMFIENASETSRASG